MPAPDNIITTKSITANPREIDFVSRFGSRWQGIMDILGISYPVRKAPGTLVKVRNATGTLNNATVAEGEEIPYSAFTVTETPLEEIKLEKYRKGVSLESINEYGYDVAIAKTDDAFLNELQKRVLNKMYGYFSAMTATETRADAQKALAYMRGRVTNVFRGLNKDASGVVGFVNVDDFYAYLGGANIAVQTQFGMTYVENFLGYRVIFLCADNEVASGKAYATAVDNLILYYVDPSDGEFGRAGLDYVTDGVTNLIGFHTEGNYGSALSESFAVMGLVMTADYADGVIACNIGA